MKYNVKFSCGHKCEIALFGKVDNRLRTIEWYEEVGVCRECYKKQKRIEEAVKAKKSGLHETEVSYEEYLSKYPNAKVIRGSYNGDKNTIRIYI